MHRPQPDPFRLRNRARMLAGQPPVPDGRDIMAPPAEWFRVTNAEPGGRATVLVYGDIGGWWGVDADRLVAEIHALEADGIDVHINSHGGDMFDGFAIYATLRQHPAQVTTWVDGVAASAASIIAMAGDKVIMERPSRLMIHCASVYRGGTALEHRAAADLLEEFDLSIADVYANRGGGDAATFLEAMQAETWYSAAAALEVKLADEIAGEASAAPETRTPRSIRARARANALGGVSTA